MKKRIRHKDWPVWHGMRQRCSNPNRADFIYYGGKGVTVCSRWAKFKNFLHDMGERPTQNHTIERINNNGDYCPENCRWATRQEQMDNTKTTLKITHQGKTQSLSAWAREMNMSVSGMWRRWHTHGTIERSS